MGKMRAGNIMVSDIYYNLYGTEAQYVENPILYAFWKTNTPIKIILFSWLVYHNNNLTWENLQKVIVAQS